MTLAPEIQLVVDCSRIRPQPDGVERIRRRIGPALDWQRVLQTAIPHGMLPLMAHNLSQYAADLTPPETLLQMRSFLERVRRRNEEQCLALNEIMQVFGNERLQVLAFKGPTLAARAYGDWALRESHDLDLWTDSADLARAGAILRTMSFQPVGYKKGSPVAFRDDQLDRQTQFISVSGKVIVELQDLKQDSHFHFQPDFVELWQRREAVILIGCDTPAMCPEDQVLALAAHGSKHVWRRLNWVVDIAALIDSTPAMDWNAVFERALRWRCLRRLVSALALAVGIYGCRVPNDVESRIVQDARALSFLSTFLERIVQAEGLGNKSLRAGRLRNAVGSSIRDVAHHCRFTDRTIDCVSVGSSEVRRRLRWLLYFKESRPD